MQTSDFASGKVARLGYEPLEVFFACRCHVIAANQKANNWTNSWTSGLHWMRVR
jgi:hypothetical protein